MGVWIRKFESRKGKMGRGKYGRVESVIPFLFFLFGIIFGSFLNVCIARIPEGMSIISPGSRCPRCGTPIKPYDNIPVMGWILLRGKCRNCQLPISLMYPVVEFCTGMLFVATFYTFGLRLATLKFLVFGCLMIVLIVTDVLVRLLPDKVNLFGFVVALVFATRVPPEGISVFFLRGRHVPVAMVGLMDALAGAALGSFLLWAAAALYKVARKRDGMGFGDVKMMGMVGAFLGLRGTFLTILLGTLLGIIGVLFLMGWQRKLAERAHRRGLGTVMGLRWTLAAQYQLPLGTFLGIAALAVVYVLPRALYGGYAPYMALR